MYSRKVLNDNNVRKLSNKEFDYSFFEETYYIEPKIIRTSSYDFILVEDYHGKDNLDSFCLDLCS
jgi:hypothetical protein